MTNHNKVMTGEVSVAPPPCAKKKKHGKKHQVHPTATSSRQQDLPLYKQQQQQQEEQGNHESLAKKKKRLVLAIVALLLVIAGITGTILGSQRLGKDTASIPVDDTADPSTDTDQESEEEASVDIFSDFETDGSWVSLYQVKLKGDVKGCSKSTLTTMKISCPVGALLLYDPDLPHLGSAGCQQTDVTTVSCPALESLTLGVACYGDMQQDLLPQVSFQDEEDSYYTCNKDIGMSLHNDGVEITSDVMYGGSVTYHVGLANTCGTSTGQVKHQQVTSPDCPTSEGKSCRVRAACSSLVTCNPREMEDCQDDNFCQTRFDAADESNVVTASAPLELCMQPFTRSIPDGDACDYNPMCQSGVCIEGMCEPEPRQADAVCEENEDCTSGLCTHVWPSDDEDNTALQTCCDSQPLVGYYSAKSYCRSSPPEQLQPVGGKCEADPMCYTQKCDLGICRDSSLQWMPVGNPLKESNGLHQTMSGDGSVVAVVLKDGVGVFEYKDETDEWSPLGNVLFEGEAFGIVLALSEDGRVLAVGDHTHSTSGQVRVYELDEEMATWKQRGEIIHGKGTEGGPTDATGSSVALSSDGKKLAVGSPSSSVKGANSGSVRVYEYTHKAYEGIGNMLGWKQMGQTLHGEAPSDFFGYKQGVSLSGSGMVLAVGSAGHGPSYDPMRGHVQVWAYDCPSHSWLQRGDNIEGEEMQEKSGWSLALSKDASTVAIGSPLSDKAGQIRVFRYSPGGWWYKLGQSLGGLSTFGHDDIVLSANGSLLAVPSKSKSTGEESNGVKVFRLDKRNGQDVWKPFGNAVEGPHLGRSLAASSDAQTLSVGSANGLFVFHIE